MRKLCHTFAALVLVAMTGSLSVAVAQTSPAPAAEGEDDAPLPPEEAARTMVVPEGFQVTLFAGEPDVHAADRLLHRRPRPAVGGRGVQLSAAWHRSQATAS